ncbi:MAG: prepilin-type N-terminal cleavage/methylation domain-containing protein [Syntrophaceae bacterium]|nr:prepilin-type N-terminal cleavage/methylation domain-containing protein [Syntrophaceae bacterium]
MRKNKRSNQKGITLIELLVALVICAMVIAGIYRLFIVQSKAYTVQDQVVEIQQNIRSAMEVLLRDLRMAGYDSDGATSQISIANPIIPNDQSVTVNYEYDDTHRHEITYSVMNGNLTRQLTIFTNTGSSSTTRETILENVEALNFIYGVDDGDEGDAMNRWANNVADIKANEKVVAVRVTLTAKPDETNPDVKKWVSPRTLTSAVTIRNLCLK